MSCYPNAGLPNPMSETGFDETPRSPARSSASSPAAASSTSPAAAAAPRPSIAEIARAFTSTARARCRPTVQRAVVGGLTVAAAAAGGARGGTDNGRPASVQAQAGRDRSAAPAPGVPGPASGSPRRRPARPEPTPGASASPSSPVARASRPAGPRPSVWRAATESRVVGWRCIDRATRCITACSGGLGCSPPTSNGAPSGTSMRRPRPRRTTRAPACRGTTSPASAARQPGSMADLQAPAHPWAPTPRAGPAAASRRRCADPGSAPAEPAGRTGTRQAAAGAWAPGRNRPRTTTRAPPLPSCTPRDRPRRLPAVEDPQGWGEGTSCSSADCTPAGRCTRHARCNDGEQAWRPKEGPVDRIPGSRGALQTTKSFRRQAREAGPPMHPIAATGAATALTLLPRPTERAPGDRCVP